MAMSIYYNVSKLSVLHCHMALSIYSDVSKYGHEYLLQCE